VLVGRRAQGLGEQLVAVTRSDSSPRRELNAVPSTPSRSPRSRSSQHLHALRAELIDARLSWILPERSTRSRNAILPGRGARARRPAMGGKPWSPPRPRAARERPVRCDRLCPLETSRGTVDAGRTQAANSGGARRTRRAAPRLSPARRLCRSRDPAPAAKRLRSWRS